MWRFAPGPGLGLSVGKASVGLLKITLISEISSGNTAISVAR